GGFPGAAVVGREDILELLEKKEDKEWNLQKKMFHYGTFNANPISASAGSATLKIVVTGEPIDRANRASSMLIKGLNEVIDKYQLSWCVYGEFSGFRFLLNHTCPRRPFCDFRKCDYDYRKLKGANDPILTQNLRCGMLLNGIDITEQGGWVSAVHTPEDIEKTILAFDKTVNWMKKDGLI
ncbi:MAG: aminotransferase class III-fold pyridoxal phosphate-dependent enzyme, partial [Candidatus Hodarchaeales archaeon]